ncbi:MAG: HD-GYP domain-containing protein, partial [Acidimicrobiia bacterium]
MGGTLTSFALRGDTPALLREVARRVSRVVDARQIAIGIVERTDISVTVWEIEGGQLGESTRLALDLEAKEPLAEAVRSGQPIDDFIQDRASLLVSVDFAEPIIAERQVTGVIGIATVNGAAPNPEAISEIASQAALALEHVKLRSKSRSALQETVTVLAALIEGRDAYTESHCVHIAEISLAMAVRLGLEADRLDKITFAGLLHDIGKIAVPDSILTKPGALTGREYDQMKTHAAIGEEILDRISLLAEVAPIVGQHHERLDGSGYPRGLRGEDILLEARILAVSDTFDAMTTTRPY